MVYQLAMDFPLRPLQMRRLQILVIETRSALHSPRRASDDTIAKTEEVIAKLKQVRAGLLHDLLHYGLEENGQLRDPIAHPEQFQDSSYG